MAVKAQTPDAAFAFVSYPDVSHTAWRVTRPFKALAAAGVPTALFPSEGPNLDGWVYSPAYDGVTFDADVKTLLLHRAEVPFAYRAHFVAWVAKLRAAGVTVIYDTDDDCYSPAWATHQIEMATGYRVEEDAIPAPGVPPDVLRDYRALRAAAFDRGWILQHVDGVTVSTAHLAGVVKRHAVDRPVIVVPNAIDVEAFEAGLRLEAPRPWADEPGVITIGWCAGTRPVADFAPVREAWARIARRFPHVRFVMAGAPQPLAAGDVEVPHDLVMYVPYATMDDYPWGMRVDIGCCSAADTMFNRARSPIKAWEFALAGAAVIMSPTVYANRMAPAATGLVAETAEQWEHELAYYIAGAASRAADAEYYADWVRQRYALHPNIWRWPDAWRAIARHAGVRA